MHSVAEIDQKSGDYKAAYDRISSENQSLKGELGELKRQLEWFKKRNRSNGTVIEVQPQI